MTTVLGMLAIGILGGISSWEIRPAMSQAVEGNYLNRDRGARTRMRPQQLLKEAYPSGNRISTKANDLFLSSHALAQGTSISGWQMAQRELDLEKFCQDYPYNSRCSRVTPSGEPNRVEESLPYPRWI